MEVAEKPPAMNDNTQGQLANGRQHDRQTLVVWLQRVADQRDRQAFAALFSHFAPLVYGYLLRGGCHSSEAEEVVQETMIRVWHKADQYQPSLSAPSTWVFTIARNLRVDRVKRERVQQDIDATPLSDDAAQAQANEDRSDAVAMLQQIEQLPQEQNQVLQLMYLHGMTQSEISRQLKLPLGTVKSRVRLAYQTLRRSFGIPQ